MELELPSFNGLPGAGSAGIADPESLLSPGVQDASLTCADRLHKCLVTLSPKPGNEPHQP